MDWKKKAKKPWIKILLTVIGILVIAGLSIGVVKANDYYQVKKLVKIADELNKQEKYQEAIEKLHLTQNRWTVELAREQINTKLNQNLKLLEDQNNFNAGKSFFDQSKWQEAKDSYAKVSDEFPHYQEAQDKIKECQTRIDEQKAEESEANTSTSTSITKTCAPFPTIEPADDCSQLTGYEGFSCSWGNIDKQRAYDRAKEAWYAENQNCQ